MVDKVNGVSFPGQHLTGGLNYYTVRTLLDIRPTVSGEIGADGVFDQSTADISNAAQQRLDKLVEVISTRAQPVIMGRVRVSTEAKADITDLPAVAALPGPNVDVYVFKFAIEHNQAWEVSGNNPDLAETLHGIAGFVFTAPTTNNNISISMDVLL